MEKKKKDEEGRKLVGDAGDFGGWMGNFWSCQGDKVPTVGVPLWGLPRRGSAALDDEIDRFVYVR